MIDLIKQYWQPFLWGSPNHISGLAMTLWLTIASCVMGFGFALPLSVARAAGPSWIRWPIRVFTFLFRGTPLYVQLLIIYSAIYGLDFVRNTPGLGSFFKDALNCTILAFTVNTCAYTTELLAGAVKATPRLTLSLSRKRQKTYRLPSARTSGAGLLARMTGLSERVHGPVTESATAQPVSLAVLI